MVLCVCGGWGWEGERLIYGFPFEGRHAWINQSCCRKRESGNTKLLVIVCVSASPLSCDWGMGRLVGAKRRGRRQVSTSITLETHVVDSPPLCWFFLTCFFLFCCDDTVSKIYKYRKTSTWRSWLMSTEFDVSHKYAQWEYQLVALGIVSCFWVVS